MAAAFRRTFVRRGASIALAIAAALPALALAQIYKCVDMSDATTYQQTPCPASAKGGKLELSTDNGATRDNPEDEASWEASAREKNVSVGMPRRFVRLALGTPRDARAGRSNDNAAEVWSYSRPDARMLVIGFRNGTVAWMREDFVATDGGLLPDDEATQKSLRRRNLSEGQDCGNLVESLGAPDVTDDDPGAARDAANAVVRYTWEPAPGDPNTRTVVTCVSGRVTTIERIGMR